MELLLFLLILTTASSSVISAGNDTNLTSTALPDITLSPWSVDSKTVQTEKTVSSTVSSQHKDVMITNHTSTTVSTTTAPLSSRHTGGTDGSNLSSSNSTPEVQTEKTESSTVSSQHKDVMINNHTSTTVSTTTAPLSSRHTGGTDGSSLSSSNSTPVGAYERPMTSTTVISNISMPEMTATPSQAPDSSLTLLAFGVMSLILILIVVMVILVTAINIRGRCKDTRQHKGIKSYDSVVLDSNVSSNCEKESITLVSVRTINTENNTDSPQISSVHSTIVDNEDQELTRDLLGIKDGV